METGINENTLLRLSQVLSIIPISKSAWWKGCKDGKYPKPLKLGPKTTVWKASEINAFLEKVRSESQESSVKNSNC